MDRTLNPSQAQRWMLSLGVLLAILFSALHQPARPRFDIKEVSVAEAKTLIDAGALVVDVRDEEKYQYRHIPGALSLPLAALQKGIPASLSQARDKPIVVYCSDGVTTGPEGTHLLNQAGFARAVNVKTGIDGWAKAGLPVQK